MKEFKGTKEKWEIDPYDNTIVRVASTKGNIAECSTPDEIYDHIAYVDDGTHWTHWEENKGVAEANARLIASAPDLLEALIIARKLMLKNGINYDNADAYNIINSAINKALGQ